jgi:HEAT repeat protein
MSAAYALGLLGGAKAISALREVLANHREDASVRGQAAESLCFANEAVPDLIAALKDQSPDVRFWSAYSLGLLGSESALAELERLASSDEAEVPGWWSVAKEAAQAIELIHQERQNDNR